MGGDQTSLQIAVGAFRSQPVLPKRSTHSPSATDDSTGRQSSAHVAAKNLIGFPAYLPGGMGPAKVWAPAFPASLRLLTLTRAAAAESPRQESRRYDAGASFHRNQGPIFGILSCGEKEKDAHDW